MDPDSLLGYRLALGTPFLWRQCASSDPPCLPMLGHRRLCSFPLAVSGDSCSQAKLPSCEEVQAPWWDLSVCFDHIHPLYSCFSFYFRRGLTPKFLENDGAIRQEFLIFPFQKQDILGLFFERHSTVDVPANSKTSCAQVTLSPWSERLLFWKPLIIARNFLFFSRGGLCLNQNSM